MKTSRGSLDWESVASRLRRQLLIERAIILLVLLSFLARWGYTYITSSAYAIIADGKPIVVVESKTVANELLDELLHSAGMESDEAEFAQKVELKRMAGRGPMDSESAMAILKAKLRPLGDKWVILIDKQPYVALDAQEQAGETLELARQRFGKLVKNLAEEPSFKENVTVQNQKADLRIWRRAPREAVELLFSPEGKPSTHAVKSGEIAGEIAEQHGMKLADVQRLNPGKRLNRLRIGERLKVGMGKPPLTVVVRNQISRVEPISAGTESITSVQMYAGKSIVLSPGRSGKRQVRVAVVYENGVETGREILEETILRSPVPRRVAVGVKSRR
ncbi:MAG: G5 domain-containing protein [Armatimonadota bacterium]|nr:G5 domain-containing protein [Armatimonadota bacterium]